MEMFLAWFLAMLVEMVSSTLQPHKDLIARLCETATILPYFSGIIVCMDIYKKGSSKGFSSVPFIGGAAIGILFVRYGVILEDETTIKLYALGVFLNVIYTIYFFVKSDDGIKEVLVPTGGAVAVIAFSLPYIQFYPFDEFDVSGAMIDTFTCFLRGIMPLLHVDEIIIRSDASIIPFPITVMYALESFLSLLYGLILFDNYLIMMTTLGLFFSSLQFILVYIYRPRIGGDA